MSTEASVTDTLESRIAAGIIRERSVPADDGCWLWVGNIDPSTGYGRLDRDNRTLYAHAFSYVAFNGSVPDGFQIDHLCRVRHCVNPGHLDAVTSRENTLRGEGPTAVNARKHECIRGHAFDDANTYWHLGKRHCRICRRGHGRKRDEAISARLRAKRGEG